MRSEWWSEEGRRHAREEGRYDGVLAAATAVLLVEAAIAAIGFFVWAETVETPARAYSAAGLLVMVLAAPLLLPLAAAALGASAAVLVVPVAAAAAWLGRRCSGREAWWWVPVVAAAVGAAAVPAGLRWDAGAGAVLAGWMAVTAALGTPALVVRRMLLPDRPPLSTRTVLGRVALGGTLAVVTAWAVAGAALHAGIGYEPPGLSAERVAGTWADGRGGTLVLAADGTATAEGIQTFGGEGEGGGVGDAVTDAGTHGGPATGTCRATGAWTYVPGTDPWAQRVLVLVEGCVLAPWSVGGSPEHPTLLVHVGDPDTGEVYVLRAQGR
ncbi:hypothetical protein [Streptomyces omiyaensis]|uniref:hypothetical protein n=1 Tax=Streptomyces omiyaensis TaxID=68247 RepID=UPI0037011557